MSEDLEVLQTEGFDAAKWLDPKMIVKKKRGRDVEVQEGWRGHVLPFELVQQELLANDLADIRRMDERSSAIDTELSEALEGLSEDDKAVLGGAVSDNGDAFVAGKLKACARAARRRRLGGTRAYRGEGLQAVRRAEALEEAVEATGHRT